MALALGLVIMPHPHTRRISPNFHGYFPVESGLRLTYNIELPNPVDFKPLIYRTLKTVGSGDVPPDEQRGVCYEKAPPKTADGKLQLVMTILGPCKFDSVSTKSLGLKIYQAVGVKIERDDLTLYENHEEVFWLFTTADDKSDNHAVIEVVNFKAAPGEPAYQSARFIYFESDPGNLTGFNRSSDDLIYAERGSFEWLPCKFFTRSVRAPSTVHPGIMADPAMRYMHQPFEEKIIFSEGPGRVKITQKVGDKTTMVMTLAR